jgi:lysozyme family protein
MSVNIATLKAQNAARWAAMHLHAERLPILDERAKALCASGPKARFQAIEAATKVPWFVVAVIAEREAGGPPKCWPCQLAQGDPLVRVSLHEPAGRGPFYDHPDDVYPRDAFYRGALDALIDCAPYASKWTDWSPGGALTLLEEYNGLGYASMGVPSAYVWSGSDRYVSGKYVADHVYRASAVDVQEGCAPLLARMMLIDKSIWGTEVITVPHPTVPAPPNPAPPHTIPVPPVFPKDTRSLWLRVLEELAKPIFGG